MSKRCQRPIEAGQARCACGCALPNNNLAVTHGGRRRPLNSSEASQSPLFQAWVEDGGGEHNIPAPVMALLVRAVETDMVAETANNDSRRRGASLTGTREQKALHTFFTALDRLHRLSTTVGLERTPRNIPDLATYLVSTDREDGE